MTISLNKRIFVNYKRKDRFNKVYDSEGEPGFFCDMKDLEDTQDFDEYLLPDFFP